MVQVQVGDRLYIHAVVIKAADDNGNIELTVNQDAPWYLAKELEPILKNSTWALPVGLKSLKNNYLDISDYIYNISGRLAG